MEVREWTSQPARPAAVRWRSRWPDPAGRPGWGSVVEPATAMPDRGLRAGPGRSRESAPAPMESGVPCSSQPTRCHRRYNRSSMEMMDPCHDPRVRPTSAHCPRMSAGRCQAARWGHADGAALRRGRHPRRRKRAVRARRCRDNRCSPMSRPADARPAKGWCRDPTVRTTRPLGACGRGSGSDRWRRTGCRSPDHPLRRSPRRPPAPRSCPCLPSPLRVGSSRSRASV